MKGDNYMPRGLGYGQKAINRKGMPTVGTKRKGKISLRKPRKRRSTNPMRKSRRY